MISFNKPATVAEPVSGTEILRRTIRSRNRSPNSLSVIASAIGVGINALVNFGHGTANLSTEALKDLTRFLHPNGARFDAERDLLVKPDVETKSVGLRSDPVHPDSRYATVPHDPAELPRYPRPVKPEPPTPPRKLPGWA